MSLRATLAQIQSQAPSPAPPTNPSLPPGASPEALTAIPPTPPDVSQGFLDQLLAFTYTLAHWAGQLVVAALNYLLAPQNPETLIHLVDPIGYLVLLTVFLIVAEIAKKITWLVVVVGWALITVRIVLEIMQK